MAPSSSLPITSGTSLDRRLIGSLRIASTARAFQENFRPSRARGVWRELFRSANGVPVILLLSN
jgi:hypothetical protein